MLSMPNIPDITPNICLCHEDVINLLLSSVALQEIALSNVINAESEKLQYIIKKSGKCYSIKELICLNESIEKVLYEVGVIENLLATKLRRINENCNKNKECCEICNDSINSDADMICEEHQEECNCDCDFKYEENKEVQKTKVKENTYKQNEYYKNYNKVTDTFNKIIGKGMNKVT